MSYTITQVAKLAGVTVRTLHFYDEIGLLKPAYYGQNGYRYYEEKQLLFLQQILFFRELGFELKKIQKILNQSDFDQLSALHTHKRVLEKENKRIQSLLKTINKTIEHLTGKQKMKNQDFYKGFDKAKQAKYEQDLVKQLGNQVKVYIDQSYRKIKRWTKKDWEKSQQSYDLLCQQLVECIQKGQQPDHAVVQALMPMHLEWIEQFWTPDKDSYIGLSQLYTEESFQSFYANYHPHLSHFLAQAMRIFAEHHY